MLERGCHVAQHAVGPGKDVPTRSGKRHEKDEYPEYGNGGSLEATRGRSTVVTIGRVAAEDPSAEHAVDIVCQQIVGKKGDEEVVDKSSGEAMDAYRKALQMDPSVCEAHLNLGRLYHNAGMLKESEQHYRAVMDLAPEDATPHFNLGLLLEDLKRPVEAARSYETAIDKDPAFADAHYNLGLVLDALGKKKDAFSHLRTARNLYLGK